MYAGDSGYPLEPYLLTPILGQQQRTPSEARYNDAHAKTRNTIERTFGVLKSRLRCLDKSGGTLLYGTSKVCKIITACAVLHNLCRLNGVPFDDNWLINEDDDDRNDHTVNNHFIQNNPNNVGLNNVAAVQVRRDLITNYF